MDPYAWSAYATGAAGIIAAILTYLARRKTAMQTQQRLRRLLHEADVPTDEGDDDASS